MPCTFSTVRGEKNLKDVTHYHCFGCATGFKRGAEVERHFKSRHSLEFGTPPQPTAASVSSASSTCTSAAKTTAQPYPAATATTTTAISCSNRPSTHHVEHMEPSAQGTVSATACTATEATAIISCTAEATNPVCGQLQIQGFFPALIPPTACKG